MKWHEFLFIVFIWALSAIMHERDMARNFKETGDAKAWFYEIKCQKGNNDADH